ncbi:MAG: 2-amino-4-hydroxy-6-hydroxymethyldihydropteridine diphosphokinase [Bacteroidales bacterium]|nr:2-amino-4-hydroxy-6-hydroxymethyldihydropteridine diphosphokinase [Candidatus Cacconaster scatequi]
MICLLLGSNLGEREKNLARARKKLEERLQVTLRCSGIMETEAIGFDGADFLNQAVCFEKETDPFELLELTQSCEEEMGRDPHTAEYDRDGKRIYRDRVIDIDILEFNDLQIDTKRLTLPHPQVWSRPFVKKLMKQLK